MDVKKIDNIVIEGVETSDYPDFCNAFIASADYDGVEMSEKDLEYLTDNYQDFVHESVIESLT